MSTRLHRQTIRRNPAFVMALILGLIFFVQAATAQDSNPEPPQPQPFDTSAWLIHLSLGLQGGLEHGIIDLGGQVLYTQAMVEGNLRFYYKPQRHITISHGLILGGSTDSALVYGLAKPGLTYGGLDLGLSLDTTLENNLILGIDLRNAALWGTITYTELGLFWQRSSLRPHLRLQDIRLEVALPLSVSWRRDPDPTIQWGIELGVHL